MSVEKFIKKLSSGIRTPSNIVIVPKPVEDERIIIEFSQEGKYVEILGHRIEGYESWEAFVEHLKHLAALEDENEKLHEENRILRNDKINLLLYLEQRIAETELIRVCEGGMYYPSIQERVYQEIYKKVNEIGEKNV